MSLTLSKEDDSPSSPSLSLSEAFITSFSLGTLPLLIEDGGTAPWDADIVDRPLPPPPGDEGALSWLRILFRCFMLDFMTFGVEEDDEEFDFKLLALEGDEALA